MCVHEALGPVAPALPLFVCSCRPLCERMSVLACCASWSHPRHEVQMLPACTTARLVRLVSQFGAGWGDWKQGRVVALTVGPLTDWAENECRFGLVMAHQGGLACSLRVSLHARTCSTTHEHYSSTSRLCASSPHCIAWRTTLVLWCSACIV